LAKTLFKDALLENDAKSHNFSNLFFVTSHFRTLFKTIMIDVILGDPGAVSGGGEKV